MCFDFLCEFCLKTSHSEKNSARCYHKRTHIGLHAKCLLFLACFNETYFLHRSSENIQISNFTKISPVEAEEEHDEANSRFPQFHTRTCSSATLPATNPTQSTTVQHTQLTFGSLHTAAMSCPMAAPQPAHFY